MTAICSKVMEVDTISKNDLNYFNHISKRNFLKRKFLQFLFFALLGVWVVNDVSAQRFKCGKDDLNAGTIRISPDPLSLVVNERCEIFIYNSKKEEIKKKKNEDFRISSDNRNVRISGFSFHVDAKAQGNMFEFIETGKLVEVEGNITIAHNSCNYRFEFPFRVVQTPSFENSITITCKGEKRQFAIAKYKNMMGKNLFVVIDINTNQFYLLESHISIDASGVKGRDGANGSKGKSGASGTEKSPNGGRGGDGGNGEDGGAGAAGGEITVYFSENINIVPVSANVTGGEGGKGGKGGKGGSGGTGYSRKTGEEEKKVFGKMVKVPIYTRVGQDGASGNAGRDGRDGQRGSDGTFNKIQVDNIKKYFENIKIEHFNIENIEE